MPPRAVLTIACVLGAAACQPAPRVVPLVTFGGPSMGARWSVTIASPALPSEDRDRLQRLTQATLTRLESLLSTWDPASELSRFNASSSLDPFPVAAETVDVFRLGADLSAETGGAMDPTLAPLVEAWGFGVERDVPIPDARIVEPLRADVGMALIEIDPAGAWVRKRRSGVRCNFSAFVPGYAADRIAADLVQRGYANVLVDVGGEIVARGRNANGQPWRIAIERPEFEGRRIERVVELTDQALSTSGDYRNRRLVAGRSLPHILDPRTGRPVEHALASVSVVAPDAAHADAIATALMVLGPDDGMTFAREHRISALFVVRTRDGALEERQSPGFPAPKS